LDDAALALAAGVVQGADAILIKGSRGMGMERLVKVIEQCSSLQSSASTARVAGGSRQGRAGQRALAKGSRR
jgi:hypothetical protein